MTNPPSGASRFDPFRLPAAVMACLAVGVGFGRFSYDALLPQMRDGLEATSATMALIASVNLSGYIAGSAVAVVLFKRFRGDVLLGFALWACVAAFLAYSVLPSASPALAIAFLPGFAGSTIFVAGIGIIGQTVERARRGISFGLATSGVGLGSFTGSITAAWVDSLGVQGWRVACVILAMLAVTVFFTTRPVFVRAVTATRTAVSTAQSGPALNAQRRQFEAKSSTAPKQADDRVPERVRSRNWIFVVYMLWGLGMVLYSTFFTTFLFDERGIPPAQGAAIYSLAGLSTLVGGPTIGPIADRWGRRRTMLFTLLSGVAAISLVLSVDHPAAYLVSVVLFGLPISGVGTITQSFISDNWEPNEVGPVFGRATFLFGVSIVSGPSIAAFIVATTGSFHAAYVLALSSVTLAAIGVNRLPTHHDPAVQRRRP